MSAITPSARHRREPLTVESLAAELRWLDIVDEPYRAVNEQRLLRLEEALVSRRARRALRRELRESAARFAHRADSFTGRRMEDLGNEMLSWWQR